MRLIDADKFKQEIINLWDWETVDGIMASTVLRQIIVDLDTAPTVVNENLTTNRQGEWIIIKDERYGDNVKCPFCGKELAGTDLNFCCKCGAYMKGGAK